MKVKLYISQSESVPVPLRGFAQRVEDTVREFKPAAGSNLVVERYNPKPDSEEEDAAQLDGIEPQQLDTGEQFYLGIAVSQLDRKQAIAAVSPQRERLLEYDLMRAIARVGNPERPKIGLMAGLPVLGERFNPFTRQSSRALGARQRAQARVRREGGADLARRRSTRTSTSCCSSTRATRRRRPNTRSTSSCCAGAS